MKNKISFSGIGNTAKKKTQHFSKIEMQKKLNKIKDKIVEALSIDSGITGVLHTISENEIQISTDNQRKFAISVERRVTSSKILVYEFLDNVIRGENKTFIFCEYPELDKIARKLSQYIKTSTIQLDTKEKVENALKIS